MNRLTKRDENGKAWAELDRYAPSEEVLRYGHEALDRLAAYEDTGLTPAQIASLQAEVTSLTAQLTEARKREKAAVEDMQYYLENNEENGVVFIPKFAVKKITNWRGPQKGEGK